MFLKVAIGLLFLTLFCAVMERYKTYIERGQRAMLIGFMVVLILTSYLLAAWAIGSIILG